MLNRKGSYWRITSFEHISFIIKLLLNKTVSHVKGSQYTFVWKKQKIVVTIYLGIIIFIFFFLYYSPYILGRLFSCISLVSIIFNIILSMCILILKISKYILQGKGFFFLFISVSCVRCMMNISSGKGFWQS